MQLVHRPCLAFSRPRAGRAPTNRGKGSQPIEAPFPPRPHVHRRHLVQGTMPKKPASKVKKEKAAPAPAKAPTPPNAPPLPMMPPFGLVPGFPPLIPPPPGVDPAVWAAAAAQHAAQQPGAEPKSKEQSMKDAAAALQSAAQLSKRRRCMVAVDEVPGFVRTVYTLLRVCDDSIIGWSEDGTQILIKEPDRFAAEVCPKFFRHRNFNSFTRLLNMYQFHKVPSVQRDSKDVCFEHPHFQRGRDDLLPLVQRKGAQSMRDELMVLTQRPFPNVSELQVASMASSRDRTASMAPS